jgi:aminoglycoside 6'-N-acetyltransferase I
MIISQLMPNENEAINQAAEVLMAGFAAISPEAWKDVASAQEEVLSALEDGRICLAARDENGTVQGWVGGQFSYGRVWELHPLVVHPRAQNRGIGRRLVAALEEQVKQQGGLTIMLGSDDENAMTSLSGIDLYADTWAHITNIQNLKRHPFTFYQKCGYTIVGAIPDANGWGKPDIIMAKRVG